ncbi:hypothetical protein FHW89_004565 [Mucilaginibacter sp. SG564]|nr:hypothetical protein [Mucilaginibacter sp. SG564]
MPGAFSEGPGIFYVTTRSIQWPYKNWLKKFITKHYKNEKSVF